MSMADPPLQEDDVGVNPDGRYRIYEKLGQGAFGEVRRAADGATGRTVAIKSVKLLSPSQGNGTNHGTSLPKAIFRELTALKQLEHKHIVRLIDVYSSSAALCLVMEYVPWDLSTIIANSREPMGSDAMKSLAFMLCSALAHCHENGVVHRDIKPSNVLVSRTGLVKLADFGLARVIDTRISSDDLSFQVATRWYRAPELLYASRRYDNKVDVWALGVVLAELQTLAPLFSGNNDIDQMVRVFMMTGTPNEDIYPGCSLLPDFSKISFNEMKPKPLSIFLPKASASELVFLSSCIQLCPVFRASSADLLKSDYFSRDSPTMSSASDMSILFEQLSESSATKSSRIANTNNKNNNNNNNNSNSNSNNLTGQTALSRGSMLRKVTLDDGLSKDEYASLTSSDVQSLLSSMID